MDEVLQVSLLVLFLVAVGCSYINKKFERDRKKAFEIAQDLERFKVFR